MSSSASRGHSNALTCERARVRGSSLPRCRPTPRGRRCGHDKAPRCLTDRSQTEGSYPRGDVFRIAPTARSESVAELLRIGCSCWPQWAFLKPSCGPKPQPKPLPHTDDFYNESTAQDTWYESRKCAATRSLRGYGQQATRFWWWNRLGWVSSLTKSKQLAEPLSWH